MRMLIFMLIALNTVMYAQKHTIFKKGEACFEYREPYFTQNFDSIFRKNNHTHTIENTWGLWGHNIRKFIPVDTSMLALIDGRRNDTQFCFSSPALQYALAKSIRSKQIQYPDLQQFMIMPEDNSWVCQCDACSSAGNTPGYASPAVFRLLNKLAIEFPKLQFFGTAYSTTQKPPPFSLQTNVGVMLSTMSFPKGIIVENSAQKETVLKIIKSWKSIAGKIYLWDYAVNFDNFFEFYPTVLITQRNLQFYEKQGIKGVFLQGNETGYAAFGKLKSYLYAHLLLNPYVDIPSLMLQFLKENYPISGKLLYEYYLHIEHRAFQSKYQLNIYGGMNQSYQKYLQVNTFEHFYDSLTETLSDASPEEKEKIAPLLLALTFQWLEIKRTTGSIETDLLKKKCLQKLNLLSALQLQTGIHTYNEAGNTLKKYQNYWNTKILSDTNTNIFKGKTFRLLSVPDEDYPDSKMLNDGLRGFDDYYNNWFLATRDNIKLQIETSVIKNATTIRFHFLNDPKHRIYPPAYIIIEIEDRLIKKLVNINPNNKTIIPVDITIENINNSNHITIEIVKQPRYIHNSIACDEIIFN